MFYSIDALTNLTTDGVHVCEGANILAAAPLGPVTATSTTATADSSTPAGETQSTSTNGPKPLGPEAVAQADPNRTVAVVDGKPLLARQVMQMLSHVPPPVRQSHESDLPRLVQQIYLEEAIADEATKLHLDKQQPWAAQLYDAWKQTIGQFTPPRTDIPAVNLQWQNMREHILWKAYFSQGATAEERVALLKQKREQYKIQVQDQDFFTQPSK